MDEYVPGCCPGCGGDWRVGPGCRALRGVRHCGCRLAVGGVHLELLCKDCDVVRLAQPCADPSQRSVGLGFHHPDR